MCFQNFLYKFRHRLIGFLRPARTLEHCDGQNSSLRAYRLYDGEVQDLQPVQHSSSTAGIDQFILEPNLYSVDGQVFDLSEDGLYRFYRLPEVSLQCMVCSKGVTSLLKMLGYLWSYGNQDDALPLKRLKQKIRTGIVSISCGNTALLTADICKHLDIPNRLASSITLQPWGGQDDGHNMIEIHDDDGEWMLYDPSFHRSFARNGTQLNAMEFLNTEMSDISFIIYPNAHNSGQFTHKEYDYAFWIQRRMLSDELLREWYQHIKQVIAINHNGQYESYLTTDQMQHSDRISSIYNIIDQDSFVKKFY